jgi:hypothetical protein
MEVAEEQAPGAGAEAPVTRRSTKEAARAVEAPARVAEASGSAAVATPAASTVPRRALEEEEAGLLHLEVSNRPSGHPGFGTGV